MMFRLGLKWALRRLLGKGPLLALGFAVLVVAVTSTLERRSLSPLGLDRVLLGAVAGMVIPLLAYAAVSRLSQGKSWSEHAAIAAQFGGDRRWWFLGCSLGAGTLVAAASCGCGAVALLGSGDTGGLPIAVDLLRTGTITALAGFAYVAMFAWGATIGGRGQLRPVLLVLDWLLGGLSSSISLPFPRGHVKGLLGAEGVIGMTQGATWMVLWGLVLAYMLFAGLRTPR